MGHQGEFNFYMEKRKAWQRTLEDVLSYLMALMTFAHTWAYAGSYLWPTNRHNDPSTKPPDVIAMPLTNALRYPMELMTRVKVIKPHLQLEWLRSRDDSIRTAMCTFVNKGDPPCEALDLAMSKYEQLLNTTDVRGGFVLDTDRKTPPRSRSRPRSPKRSNPVPRAKAAGNKGTGKSGTGVDP